MPNASSSMGASIASVLSTRGSRLRTLSRSGCLASELRSASGAVCMMGPRSGRLRNGESLLFRVKAEAHTTLTLSSAGQPTLLLAGDDKRCSTMSLLAEVDDGALLVVAPELAVRATGLEARRVMQ